MFRTCTSTVKLFCFNLLMFLYFYLVSPSNDSTSSREWNNIIIVIVLLLSFAIIIAIVCICVCCIFLTAHKRNGNNNPTVQLKRLTRNKFGGSNTETIYPPRSPTLSLPREGNSSLKNEV